MSQTQESPMNMTAGRSDYPMPGGKCPALFVNDIIDAVAALPRNEQLRALQRARTWAMHEWVTAMHEWVTVGEGRHWERVEDHINGAVMAWLCWRCR